MLLLYSFSVFPPGKSPQEVSAGSCHLSASLSISLYVVPISRVGILCWLSCALSIVASSSPVETSKKTFSDSGFLKNASIALARSIASRRESPTPNPRFVIKPRLIAISSGNPVVNSKLLCLTITLASPYVKICFCPLATARRERESSLFKDLDPIPSLLMPSQTWLN